MVDKIKEEKEIKKVEAPKKSKKADGLYLSTNPDGDN